MPVWTTAAGNVYDISMPAILLSDSELRDVVRACRALAHHEEKNATKMDNPDMRRLFATRAQRFRDLAVKLKQACEVRPKAGHP